MTFPSVYEMTNPLTTVRKQHFVGWFNGSQNTVSTTKTFDHAGDYPVSNRSITGGTSAGGHAPRMGILIESGHAAVNSWVGSIQVKLKKTGTPTGNYYFRIRDSSDNIKASGTGDATSLTTSYAIYTLSMGRYVQIEVGDRICVEYDNTTYASGNRIEMPTSSPAWVANTDQQYWDYATNAWLGDWDGAAVGRKWQITFDSSPASVNNIPTSRWFQTGTGTFSMSDEIDGGFNIYTNSVKASISFNNIREYSETGSVYIGVGKILLNNGADIGHYGFMDNTGTSTSSLNAFFEVGAATTLQYNTNNARTSTSVSNDTNWHVLKSECKASSCEGTIDGVLSAERTTSLPTAPQQPVFENRGAGGVSNARIRYIEAYNT